jgi:hypothetical protein
MIMNTRKTTSKFVYFILVNKGNKGVVGMFMLPSRS